MSGPGAKAMQAKDGSAARAGPTTAGPRPHPRALLGQSAGNAAVHRLLGAGGDPLPPQVRGEMEARFGADFGGVRVHTGPRAAEASDVLGAKAFTVGQDVAFGEGRFAPEAGEGKRLLAHELAHVVQQGRGGTTDPGAAEVEAQSAGQQVAAGAPATVAAGTAVGVQCDEDPKKKKEFSWGSAAWGFTKQAGKFALDSELSLIGLPDTDSIEKGVDAYKEAGGGWKGLNAASTAADPMAQAMEQAKKDLGPYASKTDIALHAAQLRYNPIFKAAMTTVREDPNASTGDIVLGTLNELNPAYHAAMGVVKANEAYEKGDSEAVGKESFNAVKGTVDTVMLATGAAKALTGGAKALTGPKGGPPKVTPPKTPPKVTPPRTPPAKAPVPKIPPVTEASPVGQTKAAIPPTSEGLPPTAKTTVAEPSPQTPPKASLPTGVNESPTGTRSAAPTAPENSATGAPKKTAAAPTEPPTTAKPAGSTAADPAPSAAAQGPAPVADSAPPANTSAPKPSAAGSGRTGTPKTVAEKAQAYRDKYPGRITDPGNALDDVFKRASDPTLRVDGRAAASELRQINKVLTEGIDGRPVARVEVVPPSNAGRTPDLIAHFADGTTTRVEVRTITAAPRGHTTPNPAKVGTSPGAVGRKLAGHAEAKRPTTQSTLERAILDKARDTPTRPSQLTAPVPGVAPGGTISVNLTVEKLTPATVDAAVQKISPQLGPHVERIEISVLEPRANTADPLRRGTVTYVRQGSGYVRLP